MPELNVDIICANSPQAKGRVERMNPTLQDRLVKELRLAGVSGMEEGNAFAPKFMEDFNRRFARLPETRTTLTARLVIRTSMSSRRSVAGAPASRATRESDRELEAGSAS